MAKYADSFESVAEQRNAGGGIFFQIFRGT